MGVVVQKAVGADGRPAGWAEPAGILYEARHVGLHGFDALINASKPILGYRGSFAKLLQAT
jgi:hypothetical protein